MKKTEQNKPAEPNSSAVVKAIVETTKQQLTIICPSGDGWWTEPDPVRVDVHSGEDCFV